MIFIPVSVTAGSISSPTAPIGMTAVPECQLAREMGMCYCSLATITDYDCWKDEDVTIEMVMKTMSECLDKVLRLLELGLPEIRSESTCSCIEGAKGCGSLDAIQ